MQKNLAINFWGYFTPFGGYGISNLNWVKNLVRQGVDVTVHGKFVPEKGTPEYDVLTEEEKSILYKPFERQRIGVIETTPFNFDMIDNEVKIAYTMCETDLIGKPWVGACNSMDYVIVPNEFNKNVFIKSGVLEDKMVVIPSGTDVERFPYYKRPIRDVFTFGMVAYLNDRKSVFEVIRAFTSEFEAWEPVRLYLKSSNKDFGYYSNFTDERITTDIRHLSFEDLYKIYQAFDAFVFPSKAEGVGLPPREAMSTGLPVIVTNYSGLEDIAQSGYTYPIEPIELVSGLNPRNVEQIGNWAIVDIQELMYWMRYIYSHPEEAADKGKEASEWIREEHSWKSSTRKLIRFLETL